MKCKKSVSFANISSMMLSSVIHIIHLLTHIFNFLLYSRIFPSRLKILEVVPVHKSGENILSNYRPIAIIPAISKLFKKVVYEHLLTFVNKYNIICPEQFGFCKGTYIQNAVLALSVHISDKLNCSYYVFALFVDISKAFDS